MSDLTDLLAHVDYSKVSFYLITLFGSVSMYVFSLNRGFQGSVDFLRRFFPEHSEVFYNRLDFFVVVVSGSIIGTIFFSPHDPLHALAAGFGWVGAISVLLSPRP